MDPHTYTHTHRVELFNLSSSNILQSLTGTILAAGYLISYTLSLLYYATVPAHEPAESKKSHALTYRTKCFTNQDSSRLIRTVCVKVKYVASASVGFAHEFNSLPSIPS